MKNFFTKGATLIEIVVVVAIITIILFLTIPSISSFREKQTLKNTMEEVVNLINEARVNTLSSQDSSVYGVHFDETRAVLFIGTIYNASDSSNKVLNFNNLVKIDTANIALNGSGVDVIFQRLTGDTTNHGTIVLELVSDPSTNKTISINMLGVVSTN